MQESISHEVGDECVGEGIRADVGGRALEIVAAKENLKLSLGKKGESVHTDQIGWAVLYSQLRLMTDFMGEVNLYGCSFL